MESEVIEKAEARLRWLDAQKSDQKVGLTIFSVCLLIQPFLIAFCIKSKVMDWSFLGDGHFGAGVLAGLMLSIWVLVVTVGLRGILTHYKTIHQEAEILRGLLAKVESNQ